MDSDLVNIIITLVIPAVFALAAYYLMPVIKNERIYDYVKIGVYAAEQIFGSKTGKEKFAYVKEWVQNKFKISDEDLKNIIEAVVYEMNKIEV